MNKLIEENKEYLGEVINNEDPTFTGRCKINVFGVFHDLPDENIPWFTPITSSVFSGSGAGSLSVPKVGSYVRVKFLNGDIYSGEYSAIQYVDPDLVEQIKDDYDGTQVIAYDSDAELLILYQNMTGLKIYLKESFINIDPNGNIRMYHSNSRNAIEINNDDIIITTASSASGGSNSTGKISISSGNEVEITAPNITLNSKNIKLGKGGNSHVVVAENLIPILMQLVTAIIPKTPQGAGGLEGQTFANIKSKIASISG